MEQFSICLTIFVLLTASLRPAESASQSYGPPSSTTFSTSGSFNTNQDAGGYQSFRNSFSTTGGNVAGSTRGNDPGSDLGTTIQGPKVFRHISLFVAPRDQDDQPGLRTINLQNGAPDKHVQIVFIRAPSRSSSQQTEVQLPSPPEQKTVVYVLVKKQTEAANNVKIRGPAPTKPPAPEVYFIKYKDGNAGGAGVSGQNGGESFGVSGGASPVRSSSLSTNYGVP